MTKDRGWTDKLSDDGEDRINLLCSRVALVMIGVVVGIWVLVEVWR